MKRKTMLATGMALSLGVVSAFAAPPSNDDCSSATPLTVGRPGDVCSIFTNVDATFDNTTDTTSCPSNSWASAPDATVWFTFTTGAAGSYTITTDAEDGSGADTQIQLLEGTCAGGWSSAICDDDGGTCTALASEITANLTASTTYHIMVDLYDADEGEFGISVVHNDVTTSNDCFRNAIDISSDIAAISGSSPISHALYDYINVTSEKIANSDSCSNPLLEASDNTTWYGTWFKFTYQAGKNTWLSVYPAGTEKCDESESIFYTVHLFGDTIGTNNVCNQPDFSAAKGCSLGDATGFSNRNGNGRDKAAHSFTDHPRIDLSNLNNGAVYYVMVAQMTRTTGGVGFAEDTIYDPLGNPYFVPVPGQSSSIADPTNGKFYLALEAAPGASLGADNRTSDGFANALNASGATNWAVSNAGMDGNITTVEGGESTSTYDSDEPTEYNGCNVLGGEDQNCSGTTSVGACLAFYNQNSAIYKLQIDDTGTDGEIVCESKDSIKVLILDIFDALCPAGEIYPRGLPDIYGPDGNVLLSPGTILAEEFGDTIRIPDDGTCESIRLQLELVLGTLDLLPVGEVCVPFNCSPNVEINLSNFAACGENGAATFGQTVTVMDDNSELIMWGMVEDTTNSLCLRTISPLVPGEYYIVVDGQGSLMSYNLSVNITYKLGLGGADCNPNAPVTSVSEQNAKRGFNVDYLHPVPATNELTVGFYLTDDAKVNMHVIDMAGKVVVTPQEVSGTNGTNRHTLDVSHLTSGVYLLSVEKDGHRIQTKFVK